MKGFLYLLGALVAITLVLTNLGPMIMLGVSVWLLYVVLKQYRKSDSSSQKIMWIVAGLLVLSIAISNLYAVIGIAAAYGLYELYKSWKKQDKAADDKTSDPFVNFEKQWADLHK
ncbi:flagellar basal body rod protein [Pontibacillus salicampi]|uniref:Flagellar basal body rod protein n=1 Tax=Pontibacillus salicampi TaxID=1449801 RepID=A0ABV6LKD1_9BACI